ncbi:MAG: hypothetical protein IPM82_10015 [Saprospiraceae bacterium]|nr:hypothetical protein [Saprospiraceae bacterium]
MPQSNNRCQALHRQSAPAELLYKQVVGDHHPLLKEMEMDNWFPLPWKPAETEFVDQYFAARHIQPTGICHRNATDTEH